MGAATSLLGLGVGVTATPTPAHGQPAGAPLLDADYAHNRYRYGPQFFADEAGFLAATGATKSGITRTVAPKLVGPELASNGDFATDLSGWTQNGAGDITLSWVAGTLQMVRGAGGTAGRARLAPMTGGPARALQLQVTPSLSGVVMSADNNGGSGITGNVLLGASGQKTVWCSSGNALPAGQVNLDFWPQNASQTAAIDDVSVREVAPLAEHDRGAIGVVIDFVTPAAASGNKVLWQADCNTERVRLRLVWDASAHLRVITTLNNVEQANLDLGEVAPSTAGEVRVSAATNAVRANLDGTGIVADTAATHPGLAFLRTGRSVTGELWDGEIRRVQVFNRVLADPEMVEPEFGLQVYGDSTAAGAGTGFPPVRSGTTCWPQPTPPTAP